MKRLIALLVVFGFCFGVASAAPAPIEKKAPAKKVVAKKVVKKLVVKKVVPKKIAPKPSPFAPVPPPPPPPVAPVPPPAPVAVKAAPMGSLFGWGLNTAWTGTYLMTGKGRINGGLGAKAEVVLDNLFGLRADSVKWKVGLGGFYGVTNNGARIKAIPVNFDGVMRLPAGWLGGVPGYVGAGLNYTVYGSGQTSGSFGSELYVGLLTDIFPMGKTGFELGWAAIRANGSTPALAAEGLTLSVSQMLTL